MRVAKDHPIIFTDFSVRAILAGRKTQSRRMSERWLKVRAGDRLWVRETWKPRRWDEGEPWGFEFPDGARTEESHHSQDAPNYEGWSETLSGRIQAELDALILRGDKNVSFDGERYSWNGDNPIKWRNPLFMPRWASRIALEATEDARREPLQGISEADALAEGVEPWGLSESEISDIQISDESPEMKQFAAALGPGQLSARAEFQILWDSMNGKTTPWSSSPAPVRLAFKLLK